MPVSGSHQHSAFADELVAALCSQANPENVAGMARFGISAEGTLGVTMPVVRGLARDARGTGNGYEGRGP